MNDNKKMVVYVFMSTFNGEKYIRSQIDSILHQKNVDTYLWVRDDNSHDNTVKIIREYYNTGKVRLITGNNIGFEKSFAIISRVTNKADYFAFSDQDDEWELDRLSNAIKHMSKYEGPILYGSNLWITNSNLKIEGSLYSKRQSRYISHIISRYGALGENMYACTMVWNRDMQNILMQHRPNVRVSQDVWTQLVAEIIGAKVIFDRKETIKHRIHNNNTAGIAKNIFQKINKAIKIYILSGISTKYEIVNEAISVYGDCENSYSINDKKKEVRDLVKTYQAGILAKGKLIFSDCFTHKDFKHWIYSSFLTMINKY